MKKKFVLFNYLLLVMLMLPAISMAQINVSGTVTSGTDASTLPGVNVVEKGTTNGVITDLDGNYSISVSSGDAVLLFSYLGFLSEEMMVGSQTTIDVALTPDITVLDQVVVIGYGTRKIEDITGAVATVNENYLDQQPGGDVTKALQGSVSGVTVTSSGVPGAESVIRVRGMGTINGNDPLWIVDGTFATGPPPASEVESIQVLKDAASTAIYGSKGANGVILVTTKSGKLNSPVRVELNVRRGFVAPKAKYNNMTDPEKIGEMIWLEQQNTNGRYPNHYFFGRDSVPVVPEYLKPARATSEDESTDMNLYVKESEAGLANGISAYPITKTNLEGTDWLEEAYQDGMEGLVEDYSLSVFGGSENTTYGFHVNYYDEAGQLKFTSFDRASIRSNVESQITDWLKIGQRLSYRMSNRHGYAQNNGQESLFKNAYETSPLIPVFDEAGNLAGPIIGGPNNAQSTPYADLYKNQTDKNTTYDINATAFAELTPINGLTIKTLYGVIKRNGVNYNPRLYDYDRAIGNKTTSLSINTFNSLGWNFTNTANYVKTFGAHTFDILGGMEARESVYEGLAAERTSFIVEEEDLLILDGGESNQTNSGPKNDVAYVSYFGRLHYNYNSKYLIDFTVRQDASSKFFGTENQKGVFPGASVAWKVSEEPFMASVTSWMDYLKIRGSVGLSGNDEVGSNYNGYSSYAASVDRSYYPLDGSDGVTMVGYQSNLYGNPFAQWEKTVSSNLAIDGTLFKSLNFTLDLWQRDTKNMLFNVTQPDVKGQGAYPAVNIGRMMNKGVDLNIDYRGTALNHDLKYYVSVNFSTYRNEILKLSDNEDETIEGTQVRNVTYTRTEVGQSFPAFYGYEMDGFIDDSTELALAPVVEGGYNQLGSVKVVNQVDLEGDTLGPVIGEEDRVYIGSPHPDFTMGINLGAEYKGFDISATFFTSYGHEIMNYSKRFIDYGLFEGPNSLDRLEKSWGSPYLEDNADAVLPIATTATPNIEHTSSTLYMEDGSYLRLQNLQIGYTLPETLTKSVNISKVRVYGMTTNLFTLTKYKGLNPEITSYSSSGTRSDMDMGIDVSNYPAIRQFILGLNVTF